MTEYALTNKNISHIIVAVLSCILSFCIHIVVVFYLQQIRINFLVVSTDRIIDNKVISMRLIDVKRGKTSKRSEALFHGTGNYMEQADILREVDTLGVPPDEIETEPPALTHYQITGSLKNIVRPPLSPKKEVWQPRRDILMIDDQKAAKEKTAIERKFIPKIERISEAPDITISLKKELITNHRNQESTGSIKDLSPSDIRGKAVGYINISEPTLAIELSRTNKSSELFHENKNQITKFKSIENMLTAKIEIYESSWERKYSYFKLEVLKAEDDIMPVLPKNIIFIQDCSASMAEQRLHFCRNGLIKCLSKLGKEDRFNIISFRDHSEICFKGWVKNKPETIKMAQSFINSMESKGNTDIFASIKTLNKVNIINDRPSIALLVTDGRSTTGMMNSSDIISQFSALNNEKISVFTMGTIQGANTYLLDFLSYCNGGDSRLVTKGRWSIPETMQSFMIDIRRPILTGVKFLFSSESQCEVYPVWTGNMYLDKPLVLYGRCPKNLEHIVFRAGGSAGGNGYDMIFDLILNKSKLSKNKNIKKNWARQKIYHLIAQYARDRRLEMLKELKHTARTYKVKIPYRAYGIK